MATLEQIQASVNVMNLVQVRAVWDALQNIPWNGDTMYAEEEKSPWSGLSMDDWAQMVKSHLEKLEKTPVKLIVEHDQNALNPISDEYEDDGWKIFSFNRNHVNRTPIFNYYKPNDEETQLVPKVELQAKIDAGTAFELSYFEHGQGAWFRRGTGSERGLQCQWDTAQLAGILIAPDDWKAPEGKTPEEQVDLMLEEYNEWYNGSCYWYAIQNGEKTELDSCSGFIGAYLIEHLKEEHSELWDGDSIKDGIEVVGDAASMVE